MSPPTGKSAVVKRRSANKGRAFAPCAGVNSIIGPNKDLLMYHRDVLLAAMELMQTRLQDLTQRCNKIQAKYANKPEDAGLVDDSVGVTFRC